MIHQQPLDDTIMEMKESFMLSSLGDTKPIFRTAHFLKPIANSTHDPAFHFNPSFSTSEWPLKIHFNGWRYPKMKWVRWVDELKLKYESLWKKAGIFEAIMSTKSHIMKNQDLVYGVVEKWCCETNTFVLPFGEVTITLEDVKVLGGYSLFGEPVFTLLEDQEMKEVEEKLNLARRQLYKSNFIWMDSFIDKSSEIEHEAFLATWLAIFVFPHKSFVVKSYLFPIAVRLARGSLIALAPAVLASLYKDLGLFKKKIDDLKTMVKFPLELEVNVQSPFYLVQVWVWERFKNLQPQPKLINNGDHVLLRWHKIKPLKIDNVRLALDSAVEDFIWRPYVRSADKCGLFYPNDDFWICKKDLDNEMLSFVICLRVCELVGFESIEQYLPHRVAMQFGMDQDVPSYVPRFNETKAIAWKNYCRPISDKKLYFPPRFFEADVTTRYAKWWKQSVLGEYNFVKNIMKRKRSASSRKHRRYVGKAKSSNDVGVPPGFPPNLVDTLNFGKFCDDGSNTKTRKVVDLYADDPYESILPLKRSVSKDNIVLSIGSLEKDFNDANASKEARMSSDRVYLSETHGEHCSYAIRNKASLSNKVKAMQQHDLQFHSDKAAQAEAKESVEERERKRKEKNEVLVLFEEQCLQNQEEIARLARQQEEILQLMVLREKRDEELRQLIVNVLSNQQPSSSS
ncbi:hypothetical protein P8452_41498 [Trifolium repens]|nr:hypothetical protein P8452_41495 [Trifolium repens]WJX55769.1 hypothetical protein P8452_41498 [Trifolium repens]